MRELERQRNEHIESYRRAAKPLIEELAAHGLRVDTVGELRHRGMDYAKAVPSLIRWLPQISDGAVKEDIVRSLSVPWAKPMAAAPLIEEFTRANDPTGDGIRWAIANGLAVVADESVLEELAGLVRDRRNGKAREMLALALANIDNSRSIELLMALLDDEQTVGHAIMALGKLKAVSARGRLESLTRHPTKWVRDEARKALVRIES